MRFILFFTLIVFSYPSFAQWTKINDVDYVWGPFKIYNLSLFTENGEYQPGTRPLMLSLKYAKPVEGRDFAISLARSWSNLGITLPDQENTVDRLKKIMPNIRDQDVLSYIALEDKGYFVLNDTIIPAEFNQDFNNAVVAVWLDPRVELGKKLLQHKSVHQAYTAQAVSSTAQEANTQSLLPENAEKAPVAESGVATAGADNVEPAKNGVNKEDKKSEDVVEPDSAMPESEVLPPYDPIPTRLIRSEL